MCVQQVFRNIATKRRFHPSVTGASDGRMGEGGDND